MLDNARTHNAQIVEKFLKDYGEKVELVFLPPYSPDLNVIEVGMEKNVQEIDLKHVFRYF